jgi:hypothetical protein
VLVQVAAIGCDANADDPAAQSASAGSAAVAALALQHRPESQVYAAFDSDPIAAVGHGMIFTSQGPIAPTPEFVREAQQYYIDRLSREADPTVLAEFEAQRMQMEPEVGAPREFADRAFLVDWLIEHVQPSDAADLLAKSQFLARSMLDPDFPDLAVVKGTIDSRMAYHEACKDARVPLPPDWNTAEGKWKSNGVLTPDFVGAGAMTSTVWYYESDGSTQPRGLCIALPRVDNSSGKIALLGVICQGNEFNNACFWDNARTFEEGETVAMLSEGFNSGPDLEGAGQGTCTACHRGENAFIIHDGSALDIDEALNRIDRATSLLLPSDWVTPLVNDAWPKNDLPTKDLLEDIIPPEGEADCLDCHTKNGPGGRFPVFTGSYCASVMWPALRSDTPTMPPATYLEKKAAPVEHVRAISDACRPLDGSKPW